MRRKRRLNRSDNTGGGRGVRKSKTQEELVMEFDPNTIEHLGIQMYSTLPPVLAELVANSYDAEAETVEVFLYDKSTDKRIVIQDDGHGMTFDEINGRFLKIGQNRRKEKYTEGYSEKSDNQKRLVIGRKGLGKLSFFGITSEAKITTIKNGFKTVFMMDIEKIRQSKKQSYRPEVIDKEIETAEKNGTTIELLRIKRKSSFILPEIALSLSRSFEIFDEDDFRVFVILNDDLKNRLRVKNSLKYANLQKELEWNFPRPDFSFDYEHSSDISGKIISVKQGSTVPSDMRGIALFSRGKLVNRHEFFGIRASSTGFTYLTGWLTVSFIEKFSTDVISTNRQSLNWELEETEALKDYLQSVIRKVYKEQVEYRKVEKEKEIRKITQIDLNEWFDKLPSHERKLAKKLVDSIIQSEEISGEKAGELVKFVKDSFQFEAFKELAADIDATDIKQTDRLMELFREWRIIEAREFQKVAIIRIEAIQKLKGYIKSNAREVPTLHNFLREFPWILDSRIMKFDDEVYYSNLLREKFPNDSIKLEEDKRIDFLCVNFAQTFFIIELKRPETVISHKELDQCLEYISFIESRIGNENRQKVCCYLVAGKIADSDSVRKKVESYRNSNDVYIKPYGEILGQAEKYNQEFIERYNKINEAMGNG